VFPHGHSEHQAAGMGADLSGADIMPPSGLLSSRNEEKTCFDLDEFL
jgi:hypothetical protein